MKVGAQWQAGDALVDRLSATIGVHLEPDIRAVRLVGERRRVVRVHAPCTREPLLRPDALPCAVGLELDRKVGGSSVLIRREQ